MKYRVTTSPVFDRQAKHLAKKYPSLKKNLTDLINLLSENPYAGILLFENVYKSRMGITCKNRGKSGGARIIYVNLFEKLINDEIVLVAMYDKSEKSTMSDNEIIDIIKDTL